MTSMIFMVVGIHRGSMVICFLRLQKLYNFETFEKVISTNFATLIDMLNFLKMKFSLIDSSIDKLSVRGFFVQSPNYNWFKTGI